MRDADAMARQTRMQSTHRSDAGGDADGGGYGDGTEGGGTEAAAMMPVETTAATQSMRRREAMRLSDGRCDRTVQITFFIAIIWVTDMSEQGF